MATNPFDTNVQPVQQSAGSFRVQEEAPVQTQTFEPLISSFNKYIGAEVDQKMQERATELETQGAIDISFNNAKIEDLKNNEFTTEAYARGMRAMGAKTSVSSTVTDYYKSLEDPEIQRMTPEDMQEHLQDLAKSAGNSGDAEMDRMVLSQLANQIPDLAAKHTELHRKRLEDDGYQEGTSYVSQGYAQLAQQVNQGVLTDEESTTAKVDVFDSAMEYMYTEDQKRALLAHSLTTALDTQDFDTYEELNKRISSLGGLLPKQRIAVQRSYNAANEAMQKNKTFADTVMVATLSVQSEQVGGDLAQFYKDVEEGQASGVLTHRQAVTLVENRIKAESDDNAITTASGSLLEGNSGAIHNLTSAQQQTALDRSYGLLKERITSTGATGVEAELLLKNGWLGLLKANPDVVHKQTALRYANSVDDVFSGTEFSEESKQDVIALYELSKQDPRFLASYVKDQGMRANIVNYGGRMQLSADELSKLVQRDRQARSRPEITKEQAIEIDKNVQNYMTEYEGRESFGFWESAPDRIASAYSLDELRRITTANLRSGVYINGEAAFNAARIELEENTVDILGHSVQQGNVPIAKRMGLTEGTAEKAIAMWSDNLSNEMVLPEGDKRFLNFDSVNGTVGIIELSKEGKYTAVATRTFGQIGDWYNTKGKLLTEVAEQYDIDKLRREEAKAKSEAQAKYDAAHSYKGSYEEHKQRATVFSTSGKTVETSKGPLPTSKLVPKALLNQSEQLNSEGISPLIARPDKASPVNDMRQDLTTNVQPVVHQAEGNITTANVPNVAGGRKSGVTIASGFDLGQWGVKGLKDLNLPKELTNKLMPYLGKKGKSAEDFLTANPLQISKEQADIINKAVWDKELSKLETNFKNAIGVDLSEAPRNIQQAFAIANFPLGNGLFTTDSGGATNLRSQIKKAMKSGKWSKAADNIRTWNESATRGLKKRYRALADLMEGKITVDKFQETMDNYLKVL